MSLLDRLISLYELLILASVFMSWVRPDPNHPVVQWIHKLTNPVLEPIRKVLPTNSIGIDFSPFIIILILEFIKRYILS